MDLLKNPTATATKLVQEAVAARPKAAQAEGVEPLDLLAKANSDATIAAFFELRAASTSTDNHSAAMQKHSGWME